MYPGILHRKQLNEVNQGWFGFNIPRVLFVIGRRMDQFISRVDQFISRMDQFISGMDQFIGRVDQFISGMDQFISSDRCNVDAPLYTGQPSSPPK